LLVLPARRAVDEEVADSLVLEGDPARECGEPGAVTGGDLLQRVVVIEAREAFLAGIRVAGTGDGLLVADGVVVLALDGRDTTLAEQFHAAIGVRTKADHVAQTVDRLRTAPLRIAHRRLERDRVAVDLAEERRAHGCNPPSSVAAVQSVEHAGLAGVPVHPDGMQAFGKCIPEPGALVLDEHRAGVDALARDRAPGG